MNDRQRFPIWGVVVIAVAGVIGVMTIINMLSMAFTGQLVFHGREDSQGAAQEQEATQSQGATGAQEAPERVAEPAGETATGWRATGSINVTSLVQSIAVDDAGATIMFRPDSDTRNVTGRVTSAELDGRTYSVGDPAVIYEQLGEDGEWLSDLALWSIGMWGDEPYDGGIRVKVEGLAPEAYSGLTLVMGYEETDPSPWNGENETISWTDQRLTILHG